jgi:uncharacterized repeat protein (TIGR03803 family)
MISVVKNRGSISGIGRRAASAALALAVVLVPAVVATRSAQAQTFSVLHSFTGAEGGNPDAGLIRDASGNLYGTTPKGGAHGLGTVFKLATTGKETVLHSFAGYPTDGFGPFASLIRDASGNFYGTTFEGGVGLCGLRFLPVGCGTIFKLDPTGNETILYSFPGRGANGSSPEAALTRDASGNLYGTTHGGGAFGAGVVFKLDTAGKETILHSFTGGADGGFPLSRLVRDSSGNLYGTTSDGGVFNSGACAGSGCGVVFKLATTGKETLLHSFTGGADGTYLFAGLIRDASGNFYGTTVLGGNTSCNSGSGCGTVFKLDTTGKKTGLHKFTGASGASPYAALIRDASGNLYGTTYGGGVHGLGTVFKLATTGKETVLHSFSGPDGKNPVAALILDASGNLYGTTFNGGAHGLGTVFKLTP